MKGRNASVAKPRDKSSIKTTTYVEFVSSRWNIMLETVETTLLKSIALSSAYGVHASTYLVQKIATVACCLSDTRRDTKNTLVQFVYFCQSCRPDGKIKRSNIPQYNSYCGCGLSQSALQSCTYNCGEFCGVQTRYQRLHRSNAYTCMPHVHLKGACPTQR